MVEMCDCQFKMLVAEGLDLCARSRKLVAMHEEKKGGSGTPLAWLTEAYERDLAAWESRAARELNA